MRSLYANTYGIFDQALILERITRQKSTITGQAIGNLPEDCAEKQYQLTEAIYNPEQNTLNITEKTREVGCLGTNGFGDFNYVLYDREGNIISEESFNPEFIFTDAPSEEKEEIEGQVIINKDPFLLKLPITETPEQPEAPDLQQ